MKIFSRLFIALSLSLGVACVAEPFEPEPGDELGAEASELASAETGFADEGVLDGTAFAPVCGNGDFIYYDWVCSRTRGWELVEVGREPWSCIYPYRGPRDGRTGVCRVRDMGTCGGTPDVGQCQGASSGCNKPTTGCGVAPGEPPPPPILK